MDGNRILRSAALMVVVVLACGGSASAVDRHWNVLSGSWGIAGNWSPSGLPGSGDNAFVDFFSGAPGVATVSSNVGTPGFIVIANGGTVSVTAQGILGSGGFTNVGFNNTAGTLRVTNTNFSAFPGRFSTGGDLRIGVNSGSGLVNHLAGTISVAGSVFIGTNQQGGSAFPGVGTYNLSGGVLTTNIIYAGYPYSNTDVIHGALNVSGGGINATRLAVGRPLNGGSGVVNQTGGQISVNTMTIEEAPYVGTYNLGGGTLVVNDAAGVSQGSTFNYTGGVFYARQLRVDGQLLMSGGGGKSLRVFTFTSGSDGTIDINDNALIQDSASQQEFDAVRVHLVAGYANGAWNGNSLLRSSAAAANAAAPGATRTALGLAWGFETAISTYGGQPISDFGVFVRHTLYGDADLDATVGLADFARVAGNFNKSQQHWGRGDFTYDHNVSLADFAILAANFNRSLAAGAPVATSVVPEPAAAAALLMAAVTALARRGAPRGRE